MESPSPSFLLWGLQRDQPDARTKDGDPKAQKPQTCCSVPSALAGPARADTMGPKPRSDARLGGGERPQQSSRGLPGSPLEAPRPHRTPGQGLRKTASSPHPRHQERAAPRRCSPSGRLSSGSCLRSVRLSVLPAGGQPCVRGVRLPEGCSPHTSTSWREQSALPGSCPSARKEVGPPPSTGYRPHGTSPTPTGLQAPRLGWDWGGRSPQPRAMRTTGLRGSREQVGQEERGGARAVPGLLPAPGWGTLD